MTELKVPARNQIAPEYTWNAPSVFPSVQAWETEFKDIESGLARLKPPENATDEGINDTLQKIVDVLRRSGKLMVYASMSYGVDSGDQAATSMNDRVQGLIGKVMAATAFLDPYLLAIGRDTLDRWMKDDPRLVIYRHYIDNLFRLREHVRSAEVEELMGMLASPFSGPNATYAALTDADLKFKPATGADGHEIPVTQGTIDAILTGPDREARRTGWQSYRDGYLACKNTLANTLAASIRQDVFRASARNHASTLEAALFKYNIPVEVFHNLIAVFKKHLPTWHRYWRLRKQALGVDVLQPYDVRAPFSSTKPRIEYRQAVDMISAGLAPMGEEYVRVLRQGCLVDRWVDVYPNIGKGAGAWSNGSQGTLPFICMSYTDDIESLSTLAHELGHSMHSYLTWQKQPFIYADYSLFIAEVASNFHQAMVRAHLLKTMDDRTFQLGLLQEAMSNFHRYFFIMPTLARFELEVHQRAERGEALTADSMMGLMADLFAEGYGGEVQIDRDRVGITWATFGHLYTDYYVYQYATGISAANALSHRILSGVPEAVKDYISFLSAGSSVYPLDALKMAGVDLTTPQPVEDAFTVLSGYVDRLEKLLG